ncbi:MAG: formate hydrogenlyase, partial [Nitrososphaera sp.]
MYYLLQAVFIPLLLSPLAYYICRKYGVGPSTWFTFGVMLYSTAMLVLPATSGYYAEFYPWSQLGQFGLVLDALSMPFAIIIYVLSTVLVLYSRPYMIHKITEEYHHQQMESTGIPSTMQTQEVPAQVINNNVGIYYALFLVFAMGML